MLGTVPAFFVRLTRWSLAAACFTVATGGNLQAAEEKPPLKKVRLQLKWHHQFQFAGYYAAQKQGFYQAAGLDVELFEGSPQRLSLEKVLADEADFGVTDTDVLLARMQGKPVVVCAAVFQHSPYIMLSLAGRGVTKPSDLVGKRVMVSNNQGEAELRAMIMLEGLPKDRIQLVPHTWNNRDLIEGRADAMSAYVTVEPTQLRLAGTTPSIIRFSDYGVDFYGDTLFTTESLIKRDRALVRNFVRASMKGWDYAMDHRQEMIEHILQMPGVQERGIRRENLEVEAREMVPLIQADLVGVGHMNAGRWERIARTFHETGVVPVISNLKGFIFDPDPRPNLRPLFIGAGILGIIGGLAVLWTLQLRRRVELRTQEVKEGQQKLSAILNNTFQLQKLLDPEGRLLEANSTALRFIGLPLEELLGRWFWETPLWTSSPPAQAKLRAAIREIQAGKDRIQFESQHRSRLGDMHTLEHSVRSVRSEDGMLRFIMVEGHDITERQKAEENRRVSEANLLALVENSSGAIWSLDSDLRYLTFNSRYQDHIRAMGGHSMQIGHRVEKGLPPALLAFWKPHYERALTGERFKTTFEQEVGDKPRVYEASFNPIRNEGAVTGVSIFCEDVTEQKQLEEQLRQSQKMDAIGHLAGGVAHDFNNLLTVIQANASLARIMKMTPEMTSRAFNEIADAANRAGTLTRQLLTFSRQQPVNKVSLNLNQVVTDMNRMLQRLIGEHIQIQLRLNPDPMLIQADASMMEQVVLNLAVNARDAMHRGGTLTLTTRLLPLKQLPPQAPAEATPGNFVCLEVRDTGTGIAEEHLNRIFEPFFTTKAVGQGTGIGLATVFGIVQQHGGWITVDSVVGVGSTFSMFLPLIQTPIPLPSEDDNHALTQPSSGTGTIFIVEDELTVRTIVKHVLSGHGYKVHEAPDGKTALEMWGTISGEVDMLLTDMVMPGGVSGHQLAQQLMAKKPGLKTIYTSGYSAEMFRRDSTLPEDAVLLRKPYTAAQLIKEVQRLLNGTAG